MPGIKSDRWIREMADMFGMIAPFEAGQVKRRDPEPNEFVIRDRSTCLMPGCSKEKPCEVCVEIALDEEQRCRVISYGTSSYGYDMRVADEFKVFTPAWTGPGEAIVDPKNLDPSCMVDFKGSVCRIPPNSFALARSVERFKIPGDVLAIVLGKSTYARCGIIVNCTPLEPGWEGHVTLEISNTTPLPAKVYANEGLCQVLFFQSDERCETSYADRGGKYQGQGPEVVLPR